MFNKLNFNYLLILYSIKTYIDFYLLRENQCFLSQIFSLHLKHMFHY